MAFKYLTNFSGTIISGEATESDDGEFTKKIYINVYFYLHVFLNIFFFVVKDGASWSSASAAVDPTACAPYMDMKAVKAKKRFIKYNSILHKKLRMYITLKIIIYHIFFFTQL